MEVLEHGDIQFWLRPSVQPANADHVTIGVQGLFAILGPAGGERAYRRLRIGRKRMPRASTDRFWARVERVGSLQHVLGDRVEAETYVTKTRGERYQPGALPIACGDYAFVRADDHVRLSYAIDPERDELTAHIDPPTIESASHLVLWKRARGDRDRAQWSATGEPAQLDREGAQVVLVGAKPALVAFPHPSSVAA